MYQDLEGSLQTVIGEFWCLDLVTTLDLGQSRVVLGKIFIDSDIGAIFVGASVAIRLLMD